MSSCFKEKGWDGLGFFGDCLGRYATWILGLDDMFEMIGFENISRCSVGFERRIY